MSKFAPIALFVFNRPEHTRQTIEALAQNKNALETDLYIFSDGARDDRDVPSVTDVRNIIKGTQGFSNISVIERSDNFGLAKSVISGVSIILETYEDVIVLEDDLITSHQFINYMNDALNFYRADSKAFSVTGYTLPDAQLTIPDDYAFDTYAGYRSSSWSWGTWRDRWAKIDWGMSYYRDFLLDTNAQRDFARGGQDLIKLLRLQFEGRIDSWAVRFCYSQYQNDMHCIYPTRTLVRNIGLDNSGTHSHPDPRFIHFGLDDDWRPQAFCPAQTIDNRIASEFKSAMERSSPPQARERKTIGQRLVRICRSLSKRLSWLPLPFTRHKISVDILFGSTYQRRNGEARAAWHLFSSIRAVRPNAKFLCLYPDSDDDGLVAPDRKSMRGMLARYLGWWNRLVLRTYPARDKSRAFSSATRPNPARIRLDTFQPNLVHLHSVTDGILDVEELRELDCPIVWTLHDAWAFTGGCHYPDTCEEFFRVCGQCPQLGSNDPNDLSREVMQKKRAVYAGLDLTIVTPNTWLASAAHRSALFAGRKIEVIPHGIDTERLSPRNRDEARSRLSIAGQAPVLLFGASLAEDNRVEGDLLIAALGEIEFPCTLLTFGNQPPLHSAPSHIRLHTLERRYDDDYLADIYSASDICICASREDFSSNTVAEALACGTPCVAFAVGGLPEMIDHGTTGWLASPFDPSSLAEGIRSLAMHSRTGDIRSAARKKAITDYRVEVVAEEYAALYARLARQRKARKRA